MLLNESLSSLNLFLLLNYVVEEFLTTVSKVGFGIKCTYNPKFFQERAWVKI
jgi:hypothetical protein